MRITVELSLYPLAHDFVSHIADFIGELRQESGIEIVTNQMSTQVRGEFDVVLAAVSRCTRATMERVHPVVLVAKFLNADLEIARVPPAGAPVGATRAAGEKGRA